MTQRHISTVITETHQGSIGGGSADPDGLCHCAPQPESDDIGMCPRCKRLDGRKAFRK
jgi:hypothetical protein